MTSCRSPTTRQCSTLLPSRCSPVSVFAHHTVHLARAYHDVMPFTNCTSVLPFAPIPLFTCLCSPTILFTWLGPTMTSCCSPTTRQCSPELPSRCTPVSVFAHCTVHTTLPTCCLDHLSDVHLPHCSPDALFSPVTLWPPMYVSASVLSACVGRCLLVLRSICRSCHGDCLVDIVTLVCWT